MNPATYNSRPRATRPASRLVRGAGADREGDFPMNTRERFFYDNAGYGYNPQTETEEEGRQRCARELAAAEEWGEENEIGCLWEGDFEPYELGDAEDTMPEEVLCAHLYHRPTRKALPFSLGAIGDPTNDFMRVVAAELLLDAQEAGIVFPQCATA